jgi:hypothetical protein
VGLEKVFQKQLIKEIVQKTLANFDLSGDGALPKKGVCHSGSVLQPIQGHGLQQKRGRRVAPDRCLRRYSAQSAPSAEENIQQSTSISVF